MDKIFTVKIIKCTVPKEIDCWYRKLIGNEFIVTNDDRYNDVYDVQYTINPIMIIYKTDCKLLHKKPNP